MNAAFWSAERDALAAVWRRKGLLAAHLLGNALLAALVYVWLSMPDRTIPELTLSALMALAGVSGALWLHAAAFAAFPPEVVAAPFRGSLRRLPKFVLWIVLLAGLIGMIVWLGTLPGFRAAKPVPGLVWGAGGIVVLALLPAGSWAAGGISSPGRVLRRARYWLGGASLAALGIYLPYTLIWWIPTAKGLFAQAASMLARFGLAYLLVITSWLTLAALIGRLGSEAER